MHHCTSAGTVVVERTLLADLLIVAQRGVRSDADSEVVAEARLVSRLETRRRELCPETRP